MNIGWIPNCNDYQSQPADNPMGKSGDSTESYTTLIKNTYYNCMFQMYFLLLEPLRAVLFRALTRTLIDHPFR